MVIVAEPEPVPEQPPLVVIATARPELAVAATVNVLPYTALAGAAVVTVIVCAWTADPTVSVFEPVLALKLPSPAKVAATAFGYVPWAMPTMLMPVLVATPDAFVVADRSQCRRRSSLQPHLHTYPR
jgi:hypothetical protein